MQHAALCLVLTLMLAAQAVELHQPLDTFLFEAKASETNEWLRASRFSLITIFLSATALLGYAVCGHYAWLEIATLRWVFCLSFSLNAGCILAGRSLINRARASGRHAGIRREAWLD